MSRQERLPQTTAIPWMLILALAASYLYAFPYFDKLRSAQEMPRVLLTQQIVEEHTFALNSRLKELGSWNDLSIGPDGRYYANKSPGPSMVAVPAYLVARAFHVSSVRGLTWALRFGAVTLPAILFLPVLFLLMGEFTRNERARRIALVAYAVASPAFVYSMLLMGHQLAGICLASAFYLLIRSTPPAGTSSQGRLLAAGLLAGFAPLMDYQATLVVPALGIFLLLRSPQRWRDGLTFAIAGLPGPFLLGFYHYKCFGSPFRISYGYGLDTAPKEGVLGFVGPNPDSLHNILTTPSNGLFTMSPWLIVSVLGLFAVLRHKDHIAARSSTWFCVAVIAIYTLFVGSMLPYMARGGWSAGARQLVATLPFYAVLASVGFERLERRQWVRSVASGLILASTFVFTIAATTYPHWPDRLTNPLFELSIPLLAHGYAVPSFGTWLGLRGLASLLPLYALVAALCAWPLLQRETSKTRSSVVALATAAIAIALYSQAPRTGPYADHALKFAMSTWDEQPVSVPKASTDH